MDIFNEGSEIMLRNDISMPGLLQLTKGRSYTVLNIGRAQNPQNDNLYIRNDHGRVIPYLARLFFATPFAVTMANFDDTGTVNQIIIAYPYMRVCTTESPDEMWGEVIYDANGIYQAGEWHNWFSRALFVPIVLD